MKKISISSPEGVVTAKAGEQVLASDNSIWLKTTNTGNTGWVMLFDQNQTVQNIPADIAIWATKTPPTGDVVGTTDTQTLNNKTLQSPIIYEPIIRFDQRTSSFTAEAYKHYRTTGTVTVTDPASPTEGQYYFVLVQSGTATIGGTGFGPSRVPVYRYYNGTSWATLGPGGEVVGTTATQTLTNKTIVGSTLSGGAIYSASINGGSIVNSDIVFPSIALDNKSSSFTAEVFKYYATTGTVTVTDPAFPEAEQYYFVLVQSGTATIGGVAFGASRIPIYRYYNGTTWITLPISVNWSALTNIPANINTWATKTPPTGDVVGTTDTQTLENKTLESPTINSGATINGNTTIDGVAAINGDASIGGNISVNGDVTINGNTTLDGAIINNALTVFNSVTISDNLGVNNGLYVYADSTFDGWNNTAPNQTAASASSLMTLGLCDDRYLTRSDDRYLSFSDFRCFRSPGVSVGNNGTGSSAVGPNAEWFGRANSGTAPNGYGRITVGRGINNISAMTGQPIYWDKYLAGAFLFSAALQNPDARLRIIFGGNGAVPANASSDALSDSGFGIEFRVNSGNRQFRLFTHNGGYYTTTTWQTIADNPPIEERPCAVIIENNRAENSFFAWVGTNLDLRNTSPHAQQTGVALDPGGGSYVDCVIVNPSTAVSQGSDFALYAPPLFFIG